MILVSKKSRNDSRRKQKWILEGSISGEQEVKNENDVQVAVIQESK